MNRLKLDTISQLAPIEPILSDQGLLQIQPRSTESFDNHLHRAQTLTEKPSARDDTERVSPDEVERSAPETPPPTDVESREDYSGQTSTEATEENPSGAGDADADANGQEQSDAVEDASSTQEEQQTQDDAETGEGEVVIDPVQLQADLPVDATDEQPEEDAGETETAEIVADKAVPIDPNAQNEKEAGETTVSKSDAAENARAGQRGQARAEVAQQPTEEAVSADQTDLEPSAPATAKEETPTGQQEEHSGRKGAQHEAVANQHEVKTTTPTGKDHSGDEDDAVGQPAGQPDGPQSKADGPRHSTKKSTRNTAKVDRIADATSQQTTPDAATTDTAAMARVDPKTLSIEPATTAGEPQVETPEEAIKPGGGTAESQSNVPIRTAANRTGRSAAAEATQETTEPGAVDRTRFVGRVARAFRAMGDRDGTVRLRLSPPELGSLRIEISVRNGIMTARVEAETATARNLLLDNLPALRERLAQQDIKIEQFDVDLSDRSPGGLPDQLDGHAESEDRGERKQAAQANREESDPEEERLGGSPLTRPGEAEQLNVVV